MLFLLKTAKTNEVDTAAAVKYCGYRLYTQLTASVGNCRRPAEWQLFHDRCLAEFWARSSRPASTTDGDFVTDVSCRVDADRIDAFGCHCADHVLRRLATSSSTPSSCITRRDTHGINDCTASSASAAAAASPVGTAPGVDWHRSTSAPRRTLAFCTVSFRYLRGQLVCRLTPEKYSPNFDLLNWGLFDACSIVIDHR